MKMLYFAIILMFGMILLVSQVSATKYAKILGGNWNDPNMWSATSSAGVDNAGVPTNADAVVFDAGAINTVTCNVAICNSNSLTFQSGNNKLTVSAGNTVNITGNLVLFAGMTLTAGSTASRILMSFPSGGSVAVTPAGINWGGIFQINGVATTVTVTLNANWQVDSYVGNGTTSAITLNSNTLTIVNGVTPNGDLTGTTVLSVTGGNLHTPNYVTHEIANSVTLAGNIGIDDGFRWGGTAGRTFLYSSGTITVGQSFYLSGSGTYTATSSQVPLIDLIGVTGTVTLSQPLQLLGSYNASGMSALNGHWINTSSIGGSGSSAGTTQFRLIGNAIWIRTGSGVFQHNVTIDTTTLALDPTNSGVSWGATNNWLKYQTGTVTSSGTFTVFSTNTYLNTSGMSFKHLSLGGTSSPFAVNLVSNLDVNGNISLARERTLNFTGIGNITTGGLITLTPPQAIYSLILRGGNKMTINNLWYSASDYHYFSRFNINSSSTSKANIEYKGSKNELMLSGIYFENIDASKGKRLDVWFGTVTDCVNVRRRTPNDLYNFYGAF